MKCDINCFWHKNKSWFFLGNVATLPYETSWEQKYNRLINTRTAPIGSLCWQLYVPQTVYSHNMTSWRAREARMYHWLCLICLKLSELTKHNRSNHIYNSNNMIYTIVLSITYKLSPSPHIRMWKQYFTYEINFRLISHTCMCMSYLIWSILVW